MGAVRKIRVLHVIGRLCHGGMEGGVLKVVNHVDRGRFVPFLASVRGYEPDTMGRMAPDVRFLPFEKKPGRDWSLVRKLRAVIMENEIDIIHSHNWETFVYSYLAKRWAQAPVFIHGEHGRDTQEIVDSWAKASVKSFLAWRCDRLTTVSRDIADMMIQQWRANPAKIAVIPNGIDLSKFHPCEDRDGLRHALGLSAKSFLIGTVIGSLRPVKDLPALLKAFKRINHADPDSKLIVVGGTNENAYKTIGKVSHYAEIQLLIEKLGIADSVVFAGPQQNTAQYIQAFDLYVNSSLYEGMSNTLLEAMACGVPVVATKVGGTPFIVRDQNNGLLVAPGAVDEMVSACQKLIRNRRLRQKLARNGLAYIKANHRMETFVRRHEEIYEEEFMKKRGDFRSSRHNPEPSHKKTASVV